MRVLDQLTHRPKLVALDTMNFWMDIALPDLLKVIEKVDVLTINDEEARQLSGEHSLLKAARVIHDMGPKYLIIKKGGTWRTAVSRGTNILCSGPAVGGGDRSYRRRRHLCRGIHGLDRENRRHLLRKHETRGDLRLHAWPLSVWKNSSIERLKGLSPAMIENRMEQFAELVRF